MNHTFKIVGICMAILLFAGFNALSTEAAQFNIPFGYSNTNSYSPYGYGSSNGYTNFGGFDNFQKTSQDQTQLYSNDNKQLFSEFQNYGSNDQNLFGQGYLNNQFGSFSQQGNVGLNDGYNLKQGCAVETINVDRKGKYGDVHITKKVCPSVRGTFYKNNNYQNTVNNNVGFNYGNAGVQYNTGNSFNNGGFSNDVQAQNSNLVDNKFSQESQYTSFGKGSRVFFY